MFWFLQKYDIEQAIIVLYCNAENGGFFEKGRQPNKKFLCCWALQWRSRLPQFRQVVLTIAGFHSPAGNVAYRSFLSYAPPPWSSPRRKKIGDRATTKNWSGAKRKREVVACFGLLSWTNMISSPSKPFFHILCGRNTLKKRKTARKENS